MPEKIKLNIADLEQWNRHPITQYLMKDLNRIKNSTIDDSEALIYHAFNNKMSDSELSKQLVALGARNHVIKHVLGFSNSDHYAYTGVIDFDKENLQ